MPAARRFFVRAWPLLLSLAVLVGLPLALRLNRHGRVFVDATLYLPDMVLQVPLPFRPVDLVSDAPTRERVVIDYESRDGPRSIEADLYTPASRGPHSGVVFSMGAPPLDLDDKRLVRVAEDTARAGVVILVPFSDRLDDELILPEEIDALVAEFEYVQALPEVDPERVGYFGASVGGSLALVAAADPRIAQQVDYLVSFGGYYDALETFAAIATRQIEYGGVDDTWKPRDHARDVMVEQFIYALDSPRDRDLLDRWFLRNEAVQAADLLRLSDEGRASYDFITARGPAQALALRDRLPPGLVTALDYLSPRTSADRLRAELFIIHDKSDPFIPYTESRKFEDAIGGRAHAHFDELRLFEHVEPRLNQRPEVLALDLTRVLYRLYQLLLRWD
jgi:acetyl esterase/lipase